MTLHRGDDTTGSLSSYIQLNYGKTFVWIFLILGLLRLKAIRGKLCSLASATEHFRVSHARSCHCWW